MIFFWGFCDGGWIVWEGKEIEWFFTVVKKTINLGFNKGLDVGLCRDYIFVTEDAGLSFALQSAYHYNRKKGKKKKIELFCRLLLDFDDSFCFVFDSIEFQLILKNYIQKKYKKYTRGIFLPG